MEDNFNQNEFEEFLQNQVRNHRMYPTDAVWREIDKKLHGEKRWPALTVAALVILSATILICIYFTPKPNIFANKALSGRSSANIASQKNILNSLTSSVAFNREKASLQNSFNSGKNQSSFSSASSAEDVADSPIVTVANKVSPAINTRNFKTPQDIPTTPLAQLTQKKPFSEDVNEYVNKEVTANSAVASVGVSAKDATAKKLKGSPQGSSTDKDYNDKNMVDNFLKDHKDDIALYTSSKKTSIKHKLSYQIYVAPSVSYRKLLEDESMLKSTNNNGGPVGLNYVTDVNNVVRHKPGTGIELGLGLMYNLSAAVRIKSGLQFNVRQYSIEAYKSNTELASIALAGSNGIDTVNTLSIYRNNNGYYSAELINRYYQLSIPIGIEWQVLGNKSIQLNVAASIQPTYLLNRNAYLLTTNFKNYTESPEIVRQWNVNSNIETFISFKVGDFKWQLGPQLRYQPYSTFIHQYPIKEHLMDYGIKFGMSKMF